VLPRLVSCAALALAVLGCSRKPAPPDPERTLPSAQAAPAARAPEKPTAPQPEPPYNVVLIMIDSLRADMPWAGYPRDVAPWLTGFAKRATLYPRAYSLSSYTAKSVVPALAGKYPSEMKRDGYFFTRWMPDNVLVTELLQKSGHRTMAGNGHGYFLPTMGVNQGFDDYRLLPGTFLDTKGVFDVTSEKLNKLAKTMLSDPKNVQLEPGKRFFAYFHFLDPHYTYYKHDGHPDFGNARRDLYDNEVHFTDHWVGDLVDWALAQPWGQKTAVIITADHGEGFGEHNHYRHAYEVWEALVRVPLFLYVPGGVPRRIEQSRSHIDLAPTIAELMGIRPSEPWRGHSLLPEAFGAPATERPVLVDLPRCDLMDRRRAFVDGAYKLISFGDDARFNLFNVAQDFAEEQDLAKAEPDTLVRLQTRYREFTGAIPNVPVVGDAPLKGAPPQQRY
jgi:arylsulfatase A-like enzyme